MLFSMKNEKINNVHLKFQIILVIFKFLVKLAIQGGKENKDNF